MSSVVRNGTESRSEMLPVTEPGASPLFHLQVMDATIRNLPKLGTRIFKLGWPPKGSNVVYANFSVNGVVKTAKVLGVDTSTPTASQGLTFDAQDTSLLSIHVHAKQLLRSDKLIGIFEGPLGELLSQGEIITCPLTLHMEDKNTHPQAPCTLSFRVLISSGLVPVAVRQFTVDGLVGDPEPPRPETEGATSSAMLGSDASAPVVNSHSSIKPDDPNDVVANAPKPWVPDVFDVYSEYIYNEAPTHLISVSDRRIISRDELKQKYRAEIESITEADIADSLGRLQREPWRIRAPLSGTRNMVDPQRRDAIRDLVINKLQYVIFSHRWQAEEPTFLDMTSNDSEHNLITMPGYHKLMKFLDKTAELGYHLAWSDTCCIDKRSSAELEEAIRSMFQWYRRARICVAYLADSSSLADFPREPWFTRGWTLQELLAPEVIKFYGRGWVPLGDVGMESDKDNPAILKALSNVTTIPESQLLSFTPGVRDAYMKMKWASTRRTTKIEDTAYCLLGIFDLSIPVSYGEGRWAFHRLMEALILRCNEWQIFAWAGPCSAYSDFIPASPHCYESNALGIDNINSPWCVPPIGDKAFRLEQPGLKLKLLIVKITAVDFVNASQWQGELTLRPEDPSLLVDKPAKILHHFPLEIFRGLSHQLAIGILNFENSFRTDGEADGMGQLYESRLYLALLLQHGFVNGLGKTATKHMTENLVVVRCGAMIRRALTTVYI
ncbi:hypothetical protein HYDPIDRAFT_158118 [Hydnomerulius pinastri MD-312]|uniref:C2 domain-containing protein n=1 Tax=Hydnomerulius pinastri MD-312 TaxID=994086 RepID=A0A0C9WCN2_9AGAM|nr:hypothetical protein HYDPIDRAFT_158118 [Hydnomerulius pinastri MD-312]